MKTTESKVTCTGVSAHAYKPELDSAEIRQTITSEYPSRQANSEGLFSDDEYHLEGQKFDSVRVAWVDVPKGTTAEQVQARIDAMPNARIKRILSLKPILAENQKAAIEKGITTLDAIAESQKVKKEDGELALHNGCVQYKKLQASWEGEPDVDLRPAAVKTEADVIVDETVATA